MTPITQRVRTARWLAAGSLQRVRDRISGRGLVLCYHRVAELDSDPQLLAVAPQRFRDHVELLAQRWSPLPFEDMVAQRDRLRRGSVAITFDDGYADNLHAAAPILEQV